MPELPEVETTRRGIEPHVLQQTVERVIIRQRQLRYPVPLTLAQQLPTQTIQQVNRRGKYLLLITSAGTVIIHLGMSGNLRLLEATQTVNKHAHVDIVFSNGNCLRFTDPRRFGAVLWTTGDPLLHPRLKTLGIEPLCRQFNADYLYHASRTRRIAIKQFIMDSKVLVGVGNIYANEALFLSAIHPEIAANALSKQHYQRLVPTIKQILKRAIKQGGTTLKDFRSSDGKPGYFQQQLHVYGRGGEKCLQCTTLLKEIRQGQRTTVYCPQCQPEET